MFLYFGGHTTTVQRESALCGISKVQCVVIHNDDVVLSLLTSELGVLIPKNGM